MTISIAYVAGYRAGWTSPRSSAIEPPADFTREQREQFASGFLAARHWRDPAVWIHAAGRA